MTAEQVRQQAAFEIAEILNGRIPNVLEPIFDAIAVRVAIEQIALAKRTPP